MPLTQDDQIKYKSLYLQTARQLVGELLNNLNLLQADKEKSEAIEVLHRDAHSLKGQSLMMEYQSMSSLSLLIEKIFQAVLEKKITVSDELVSKLTAVIPHMEASLDSLEKENHEKDLSQDIADLQKISGVDVS